MSEALVALREQYSDKFGKKPFHGWDEAQLTAKLAEDVAHDPLDHDGDGKKGGSVASVKVVLKRSHWIGEERHDPPEVLSVDIDTAMRLIEKGVAGRTDPLKAE